MSDKSQAANETTQINVTHGPYAGQRLTVSSAEAKSAIGEGWALDPFAPAPTEEELAKRPVETEDERLKRTAAAEKAAGKLRGEDAETGRHKEADQFDRKGGPNDKSAKK